MSDRESRYTLDILAAMAERTIKKLWVVIILEAVMIAGLLYLLLS